MRIILSTRNRSKVDQIKALLNDPRLSLHSLDEMNILGDCIEDGLTLKENAIKKALFAWNQIKTWVIADDTGLFINALGGAPGIHAARWAGANASTEDTMHFTLDKLKNVAPPLRTATFTTVAAIISPGGNVQTFQGSVQGSFLIHPRTQCQPNMPYSAIFVPDGQEKVWAEMTVEEENRISHRGKAFRQLRVFLTNARET